MVLKILLATVIFLRVILFSLPSFHIDMSAWESWSYRLVSVGPSNFYSENYFSDYFPGYLYILWVAGEIYSSIFPNLSFADLKFETMIKLITLAFDIATSYYIYKIVNNYSKKLSKLSALLYLFNPAVIFNSSIWGQVDGVFTFFIVYSCFMLEIKKPVVSSFFASIAILIKPQSLAIIPMILLYNFKFYKRHLVKILLIVTFIPIVLSVPFFINNPLFGLINLAQNASSVYPYSSLFAFNFWGLFGFWKPDQNIFLVFPHQIWGFILYAVSMILIVYPFIKNETKQKHFYIASSLSFLSFFIFLTRMHERYLFPFLAFVLIATFISKSKILALVYLIISFINVINLWYVYYFYNFVYNSSKVADSFEYHAHQFIGQNSSVFSITTVACFILILIYYYKSFNEKISK